MIRFSKWNSVKYKTADLEIGMQSFRLNYKRALQRVHHVGYVLCYNNRNVSNECVILVGIYWRDNYDDLSC